MQILFQHVLEMSISAGFVAFGVILCRFLIRKAPRWISCALWMLVAVRLVIPFSVESSFSVVPQTEAVISAGERVFYHSAPFEEGIAPEAVPSTNEVTRDQKGNRKKWEEIAPFIWCGVSLALLGYGALSYYGIKRKMGDAIPLEKGIRLHEKVDSPFILGVFRPQIYLPFGLDPNLRHLVLLHEKAHLRRMDHLAKPLAYVLLCIYWFHPVLWLSYFLFCRDIEAACDEKVLSGMDEAGRRDYARALLKLGTKPKIITVCPVAFGETNTKERIEKTMKYKKPMFWMLILATLVVLVATVCLLTDPKDDVKAEDFQDPAETVKNKAETEEKPVAPVASISGYTRSVAPLYTSLNDDTTYWNRAINKKTEGVSIPLMIVESREELFALLAESEETDSDWILTENKKRIGEHYPEDFFKDNVLLIAYTGELKRGYIASASIAAKNNGDIKVTFGYQPYPDGMGTLDDPVGYFLDCYAIPKKETDDYRTAEINMLTLKTPSPEDEVYRGVDSAGKYHYLYLWKTPITDEEPINPKDPTPYTCQFWMGNGGKNNCIHIESEKGYLVSMDLVYKDTDNDIFFQKVEGGLIYVADESTFQGRWLQDGLFLERIQ